MSILQDYESLKQKLGNDTFSHIELFLNEHPHYFLSDVYYKQSVWDEFKLWEKQQFAKES